MRVDKANNMLPSIIVYLLIFQNLFNAASPYLTLVLNLIVAITVILIRNGRITTPNRFVLIAIYIIFMWFLVVFIFRGGGDSQIFMKYLRITMAASLLAIIFGSRTMDSRQVVGAINFSLGFHVFLILIQIIYPSVTYFTAELFGFNREFSILEQYSQRRLGATSSYDTASFLSIAALIFFYLQFSQNRRITFLIMVITSFVVSLMSSRMGVVLAIAIAIPIFFNAYLKFTVIWKFAIACSVLGFSAFIYIYIFPIFLHSVGLTELVAKDSNAIISITDYGTTGSVDALTSDHLRPLDKPIYDLIIGFAIDPNNIGEYTDIGYVKLVYHVGILGAMMIMAVYVYMGILANKYRHSHFADRKIRLIGAFLLYLILIATIVNYKALHFYSRGFGDFMFILFFYLCSCNYTSRRAFQISSYEK